MYDPIRRLTKYHSCLVFLFGAAVLVACYQFQSAPKSQSEYQGLELQFDANRSPTTIGEPIHLRFTITNKNTYPIVIDSKEQSVIELNVVGVNNKHVYSSWSASNPEQVTHHMEWQPGETKTIETVWVPRQEVFYSGRVVFVSGFLSENSKVVQSVGILTCMGGCDR